MPESIAPTDGTKVELEACQSPPGNSSDGRGNDIINDNDGDSNNNSSNNNEDNDNNESINIDNENTNNDNNKNSSSNNDNNNSDTDEDNDNDNTNNDDGTNDNNINNDDNNNTTTATTTTTTTTIATTNNNNRNNSNNDNYSRNDNDNNSSSNSSSRSRVEVIAVRVPDDCPQGTRVVAVHEQVLVSSNARVRNNSKCQCCYPITLEDPVEMVRARNVAIAHVVMESVSFRLCYMSLTLCIIIFVLGVVPSSVVACCSKQHTAYSVWSCIGILLFVLHAITTIEAVKGSIHLYYFVDSRIFYLMQAILCTLNVLVVYFGCKTASALGNQTLPHHSVLSGADASGQVGLPVQNPTHLVHGVPLSEVDNAVVTLRTDILHRSQQHSFT